MATAKKLPSGSWNCQVFSHIEEIVQPDGTIKKKRVYKSFTCDDPTTKGKRKCEKMAADWAAQKEDNKIDDITFGTALDRYIEARESVLSPRTIMDYKRIRKQEMQGLMDKKISQITQEDIQREVNLESARHAPKTVRNSHGLVTAVMGVYRPNFAIKTDLPKKRRPKIYVPSDEEIQRLIDTVKGTEMEMPVLLSAFGPMRRGEISALESKDITGNIVHVCRNMVMTESGEWITKTPKSYAGDRYIPYPDFVAEKWAGIDGRIVELTPNNITNKFKNCLHRAGLPHFRFHDLRHYSASIQHALGIPDAYIMERGGWGNDGVLKNVYRHTMEKKAAEMNQKANDYFTKLMQDDMQDE
ncbi:MAG: site-specific integrase [Lachnospiraceae bacterium]|nr:site-specific integrase [Lachnospiraceae bacterium]